MKTLLAIDPGLSIGTAMVSYQENEILSIKLRTIQLNDFKIESINELLWLIQQVDRVVIEKFTNPFVKLTKETKSTIEVVGAVRAFCATERKILLEAIAAQRIGYIALAKHFAKEMADSKHVIDALAHAIRVLVKENVIREWKET